MLGIGWECIQTRQKQTQQEQHQEGRLGGEEKARKHLRSLLSNRNKLMTILSDEMQLVRLKFDNRRLEATGIGFPVVGQQNTNMATG